MRGARRIVGGLVAAGAAAACLSGCGGSGASPSQVATAAGASFCNNSGYYVQNKLTGNKSVIYDCRFAGRLPKCVTYSGNIASDATDAVQLLFANSLGAQKPACLSWRSAVERKAYQQALSADANVAWHRGYTAYGSNVGAHELPNIYYKWLPSAYSSCTQGLNGCWRLELVTRNGCPTAVSVELDEESGGTQVGTAYGNGGALSPHQRSIIEIDATQNHVATGRISSITCI